MFDEPHLLVEDSEEVASAYLALAFFLSRHSVTTVHMTATMRRDIISEMEKIARRTGNKLHLISFKSDVERGFVEEQEEKNIVTKPWEDSIVDLVANLADSYDRILVVVNTVDRAREVGLE